MFCSHSDYVGGGGGSRGKQGIEKYTVNQENIVVNNLLPNYFNYMSFK